MHALPLWRDSTHAVLLVTHYTTIGQGQMVMPRVGLVARTVSFGHYGMSCPIRSQADKG